MRKLQILVAAGTLLAGLVGVGVEQVATATTSAAASCANPQSGSYLGSFSGSNGPSTVQGSAQWSVTFTGSSFTTVATWVDGRTPLVTGSTGSGTINCNTFTGGGTVSGIFITTSGSVQPDGTWSGIWSDNYGYSGTFAVGPVNATVSDPSATSLTTGGIVSTSTPLQASVVSPTAGPLSLSTALISGGTLPGYTLLGIAAQIDAPPADYANPLTLTMTLDPSVLNGNDPTTIQIFENGAPAVQWCGSGALPIDASTDPCEVDPPAVDPTTGAVTFTILTTQASVWTFGVKSQLVVTTSSLPSATPNVPYGPVTLHGIGGISTSPYTTTLKWKKVTLPKGLKLSSTGVLSGTLNKKLVAGSSSVTVQVTETVTTLIGQKKVKTKRTVQATIPLSIS